MGLTSLVSEATDVSVVLVAGAVAAHGEQPVGRVREVEHPRPLDPGLEDLRVDRQGVAVEHDEVRVLAGLQGPDATVEVELLRRLEGHGGEGLLPTHPRAHGEGRRPQEQPIGPLPPDIYTYAFSVDGVTALDPQNANTKYGYWVFNLVSVVQVPGDGPQFYDVKPVPHGVVRIHPYSSESLGLSRTVWVYTPPGYEQGDDYPVLYLLHGGGDLESGWTMIGRVNNILDNLIAEGKAEPMVVVMPLGHPIQSYWTGPSEGKVAPQLSTGGKLSAFALDLTTDVMPLVEHSYKVSTEPSRTAIAGLSMGGAQTTNISFNMPERFGYVGIMSTAGANARRDYPKFFEAAELVNELWKLLWVAVGRDDLLVGNRSQQLHDELTRHGIKHQYVMTEGRHEWTVWRHQIRMLAPLLFK